MNLVKPSATMYAGLLLFGILLLFGCLKEGIRVDSSNDIQLVVVPSVQEAEVGDTVNFDILLLGEIVEADLYINHSKISGHQYVFQEPGIYTIHAEKDGIKSSDSIEIQINQSARALKLEVSETQITVGESVSFAVLVLGDTIDADIYIDSMKLSENTYVFDETGTFKAYAVKEGYIDSDTIAITVHAKEQLILTASSLEIKAGDKDTFHVVVNGSPVTDADIYVDDTKIADSIYQFDKVGTYSVYALRDGFANSDTLEISVIEAQLPKLSLSVTKTKIHVGEQLTLSPMYIRGGVGSQVKDAKVYVGGKLVEIAMEGGYPFIWWSDEPGTFEAYAHKEGFENSDTLTIVVEGSRSQLIVIPSETTVTAGTNVTFSVKMMMNGKEQPAADAQIYINNDLISGYQYTFETAGSYKVIAKAFGGGILDSDPVTITVTENTSSAQVHVVGFEESNSSSSAKYWHNSASDVTTLGVGKATGIFNFSGDIHVSGYVKDDANNTYAAKYWKNTSETTLKSGQAQARSVFVERSDGMVFIAGSVGQEAVYWQDGAVKELGSEAEMVANDIVYDDGSIYAVGNALSNGQSKATIWAWGDRWALHNDGESAANAITVQNGDYYVAGAAQYSAVYWKSGSIHRLTTPNGMYAMANDIALDNSNIYIAGIFQSNTERRYAVVWINGTMTELTSNSEVGGANAIAVASDGTIYVAGWKSFASYGNKTAMYWQIDGSGNILKAVALTDGTKNAEATGIDLDD